MSARTGGLIASIVVGCCTPALAGEVGEASGRGWFSDALGLAFTLAGVVVGPAMLVVLIATGAFASFRGRAVRDVTPLPSWIWFLAAVSVLAAMIFAAGVASMAVFPAEFEGTPGLRESVQVSLSAYLGAGLACVVMGTGLSARAPEAGLEVRWRDVPRGLLAFVMWTPVVLGVGHLALAIERAVMGPRDERIVHELLSRIVSDPDRFWAYVGAGVAVVAAPIVEEVVYRGFFQSTLLRATRSPWVAIVVTAGVFSVMHAGSIRSDAPGAFAVLFVLGVALGVVYERTRSLVAPVVLHMGFNAVNVGIALASGG